MTKNIPVTYDDLLAWFQAGEKTEDGFLIGSEHEKFIYHLSDLTPVAYDGIATILRKLQEQMGGDAIMEGEYIIGLKLPPEFGDESTDENAKGRASITLEPGGQMELSGAPLHHLHHTCSEITQHIKIMQQICDGLGYGMLALGYLPQYQFADIPKMPKKRYNIMREWMPKKGTMGLDMMHMTTTVQVNIDYLNEKDMAQKMRIGAVLQPFTTALFASSPIANGKMSPFQSMRANIWQDTDNQRCGVPEIIFADDFNYQMWIDYLLDIPVYFLNRGVHDYVEVEGATFRELMEMGEDCPYAPITLDDFITHTATVFPDVRLKNVIEMRGADCSKFTLCCLPAFWIGLLYNAQNQQKLYDMLVDFTHAEIMALRQKVVYEGMNAIWAGKTLYEWGELLLPIAEFGLKERNILNDAGQDETIFLNHLKSMVEKRETIADRVRDCYEAHQKDRQGDMQKLYQEFSFTG